MTLMNWKLNQSKASKSYGDNTILITGFPEAQEQLIYCSIVLQYVSSIWKGRMSEQLTSWSIISVYAMMLPSALFYV
jgi:hypothetical protein